MKVGDLVMYDFGDVESEMMLRHNLDVKINQGVVNDIIKSGNIEATIGYSMKNHISLIDCMGKSGLFAKELSEKEIQNLGAYFLKLNFHLSMKLWTFLGAGELKNTTALHRCTVGDTAISARIVDLLCGPLAVAIKDHERKRNRPLLDRYGQAGIITSEGAEGAVILWPDCVQEVIQKDLLRVVNENR